MGIKASLGMHRLKQWLHCSKDNISICDQLTNVSSVLICLPEEREGVETVMSSMQGFRQIFPQARITLLNSAEYSLEEYILNDFSVVEYDESQLTRWGAPAKALRSLLYKQPVGIAIDLSKNFHRFNTLMICSSRARLKIGFSHPQRNKFYNFVIRLQPNHDWDRSLATLFRYLSLGTPVYA
ncbi:hypothetical protein JW992_15025 [candidate division KSB1 bacterium]|nr:hypothetical protein [candidate division KSB1 bacterium]